MSILFTDDQLTRDEWLSCNSHADADSREIMLKPMLNVLRKEFSRLPTGNLSYESDHPETPGLLLCFEARTPLATPKPAHTFTAIHDLLELYFIFSGSCSLETIQADLVYSAALPAGHISLVSDLPHRYLFPAGRPYHYFKLIVDPRRLPAELTAELKSRALITGRPAIMAEAIPLLGRLISAQRSGCSAEADMVLTALFTLLLSSAAALQPATCGPGRNPADVMKQETGISITVRISRSCFDAAALAEVHSSRNKFIREILDHPRFGRVTRNLRPEKHHIVFTEMQISRTELPRHMSNYLEIDLIVDAHDAFLSYQDDELRRVPLRGGDIILHSGEMPAGLSCPEGQLRYFNLAVTHDRIPILPSASRIVPVKKMPGVLHRRDEQSFNFLRLLMENLFSYQSRLEPSAYAPINSLLDLILDQVLHPPEPDAALMPDDGKVLHLVSVTSRDAFIQAAIKYNMPPAELSRLFQEYTGIAFDEYLREKQVLQSRFMLAEGSSEDEIIHHLDFPDVPSFHAAFTKKFSSSPAEYLAGLQRKPGGPDITGLLETGQNDIWRLAYYDLLTGLPNRLLLRERLLEAVRKAVTDHSLVGVLFIDLDGFKQVNDTAGHAAGDELLKVIGRRMVETLRSFDTVARYSGDEFVAVCAVPPDMSNLAIVAEKILAAVRRPFHCDGQELTVTASIGIACFPRTPHDTMEQMIAAADQAMYQVKKSGKNSWAFRDAVIPGLSSSME